LPKQKIELKATKYAGHAEKLAYEAAKHAANPLIISSSGDGGYSEVVNGAMKAQNEGRMVTTGVLPAGNANDHYQNLHEKDLVKAIVRNDAKPIDLLTITSTSKGKKIMRYAHSYIGIGFSPKIARELNKTKLTFLKEVALVARMLFTVKPVRLKLQDSVKYYESIIFSNVDKMSKYLKISRPSKVTDGKFEVTIFERRSRWSLILILLRASFTGLVHDSRVAEFSFHTVNQTLVQVDGEVVTLDADVSTVVGIEKQVLKCIV
jgi:diacylglycerol kinase family enzyme